MYTEKSGSSRCLVLLETKFESHYVFLNICVLDNKCLSILTKAGDFRVCAVVWREKNL